METPETTRRVVHLLDADKPYWVETQTMPRQEPPVGDTRITCVITSLQTRPITEGEDFESAVADSIAFRPDEARSEPTKHVHMSRCGKRAHRDRWFNMTVIDYSDGSSICVATHFERTAQA